MELVHLYKKCSLQYFEINSLCYLATFPKLPKYLNYFQVFSNTANGFVLLFFLSLVVEECSSNYFSIPTTPPNNERAEVEGTKRFSSLVHRPNIRSHRSRGQQSPFGIIQHSAVMQVAARWYKSTQYSRVSYGASWLLNRRGHCQMRSQEVWGLWLAVRCCCRCIHYRASRLEF